MFSDSNREFMEKNMNMVVKSIESKLNESFFTDFKEAAISAISKYIEAINMFEASGMCRDFTLGKNSQAEDYISAYFYETFGEVDNSDAYQVLDALRHSFSCYAYNGLHQLYTCQENESWHPKIVLAEALTPNDIYSLPQVFPIYRGCEISELKRNSFGQAWTTSPDIAKAFAYTHYQGQNWFDENKRTVLAATYSREHVLFSKQSGEYEVVVDIEKLRNIREHA